MEEGVPLYLIPSKVRDGIRKFGEEVERVVVKKTSRHFYNISIRSRSVNRELLAEAVWAGAPGYGGAGP